MVYAYLLFAAIFSGMVILIILFMRENKDDAEHNSSPLGFEDFVSVVKKKQ